MRPVVEDASFPAEERVRAGGCRGGPACEPGEGDRGEADDDSGEYPADGQAHGHSRPGDGGWPHSLISSRLSGVVTLMVVWEPVCMNARALSSASARCAECAVTGFMVELGHHAEIV